MEHRDRPKIVLIGAGSVQFGLTILGDFLSIAPESLGGSRIVLHDIDHESLETVGSVARKAVAEAAAAGRGGAPFDIEIAHDLQGALDGASYVIMSIEHGNRIETWKQDYYVPIKHGCRQVYGENGGAGGAFHTWRQFPPMLEIARAMERACPGAYLLNFSNPVPRLTWALNRTTKIKTVGLCHGIGSALRVIESILGVSRDDLEYTSAGLNHFYWMLKLKAKKRFVMPAIGPHAEQEVEAGSDLLFALRERGLAWALREERHFLAELIRLYGYFTYPEESHPAEYVAWSDAYCPSVKYDFKALSRRGDELKSRTRATAAGNEGSSWWIKPSGERAVALIVGIENDTHQWEDALNLRNGQTITNLPADCVVETPATVDRLGFHQERIGDLPRGIAQLLQKEVIVQEMVVEAAITGDYRTALQALVLDETVPNPQIARNILDEMLELQRDYLPQFSGKPHSI